MSHLSTKDEIWSLIRETQKNLKEVSINQKETDQQIEKISAEIRTSQKETDQQIEKISAEIRTSQKETDQQIEKISAEIRTNQKETGYHIKEMSKEIKKAQNLFTTQWGKLMESLVEGDLVRLLKEKGVEIERTSTNEKGWMSYIDEKGVKQKEQCEIDIVAKNGAEIVVVEVKTSLTVTDVRKFLDILKRFTQLLPEYRDKKVYGAVAYLRTQDSSEIYSEKNGLFVIKATGSSANIINKENFKPKVFA